MKLFQKDIKLMLIFTNRTYDFDIKYLIKEKACLHRNKKKTSHKLFGY